MHRVKRPERHLKGLNWKSKKNNPKLKPTGPIEKSISLTWNVLCRLYSTQRCCCCNIVVVVVVVLVVVVVPVVAVFVLVVVVVVVVVVDLIFVVIVGAVFVVVVVVVVLFVVAVVVVVVLAVYSVIAMVINGRVDGKFSNIFMKGGLCVLDKNFFLGLRDSF